MPRIPALRVNQWLPEWDNVNFTAGPPRQKPKPYFHMLSMSAFDLKRISGIYRRDPNQAPTLDLGIQRRHMPERSVEILRYIQDGFPLSRINTRKLVDPSEKQSLRMPGWIPTAIIANILGPNDKRGPKNSLVPKSDIVEIENNTVIIPDHCLKPTWRPTIHPIEIIDGQHRLWALEESDEDDGDLWTPQFIEKMKSIQLPVVAFHELDMTWQAYLFYTINQLPKRIDTSLVFDLYPLLRNEDWLLRFEGPGVYRETRAQDLTILMWSHPDSPWKDRILRLGGREKGKVTQASFIRSLLATFIRRYDAAGRSKVGGLFGSQAKQHASVLGWSREQQAAFLIMVWTAVKDAIRSSNSPWAQSLRKLASQGASDGSDAAFDGEQSLLASDQGCRCVQFVMNDFFWSAMESETLDLAAYEWQRKPNHTDDQAVSDALRQLRKSQPESCEFATGIATALASFDWRSSSALDPKDPLFNQQAIYRGSGGYLSMRRNLYSHLLERGSQKVKLAAKNLLGTLGFEESGDDDQ